MTSKLPFGKEAAAQAAEESRGVRSMTLTRDAARLASVAVGDNPADDSRGRREDDDSTCQQAIVVALSQETLLSRVPRWRGGRYPMRNPQVGQVRLSFNSQSPVEFRGHTAQAITGTAWCHALTGTQLLKRLASIGVVTM